MNIDLKTKLKNMFLSEMFTALKINLKLQMVNLHEVSVLEMVNTTEWLFACRQFSNSCSVLLNEVINCLAMMSHTELIYPVIVECDLSSSPEFDTVD